MSDSGRILRQFEKHHDDGETSSVAPEITFLHVVGGSHIGYGRMGVYLAKTMREQGITVYDSIAEAPRPTALPAARLESWGERTPGLTNVVCWAAVPSHARGWWEGQHATILTMWEATNLPPAYRENLHEFDTVIVPSEQNLELFEPWHKNVHYVPLGVDPQRWHYRKRTTPTTRFNFLISGRGQRKGTDLAVKAFRKAFPDGSWGDGPVPYLVMKQSLPEDFYGARIERVTGRLSGEAEADLYGEAHCYLQPSRGEGFGLQPLQAIAQGIPTILTDAHGHKAFSYLGMGIGYTMSKAGYFIYGDAGDWWEPDLDELVDTMRWTYDHYDEATARAKEASHEALTRFTWRLTTNKFLDAIGRERLEVPYKGNRSWHQTVAKLYKTTLVKDHSADVGGNIYIFDKYDGTPETEYWMPSDVKRILFEGGLLHESCLQYATDMIAGGTSDKFADFDTGLLPQQVEHIPGYIERASYCPTCHQKFGSGLSLTDKIMADPHEVVVTRAYPGQ